MSEQPALLQAPATPSARPMLIGAALGLVTAIVVAAILVGAGALHFGSGDSSTKAVNTSPIELPAQLGAFTDQVQAATAKGGSSNAAGIKARLEKTAALTVDSYQQAYDGASVAVRSYANDAFDRLATVIAVRAESPGLTAGVVQDAASLGLAVASQAIERRGDVSCTVNQKQVVPAGQHVDPDDSIYSFCERTGKGLTVIVSGSGFEGDDGRAQISGVVDDAFDAVTGG